MPISRLVALARLGAVPLPPARARCAGNRMPWSLLGETRFAHDGYRRRYGRAVRPSRAANVR